MKYYIITYGCQMNKSDSQRIAAQLEEKGYQPAQEMKQASHRALRSGAGQADLVVINVCSVRQSAVDRVYSKVKQLSKFKIQNSKFKIVLTGCLLEKDRNELESQVDEIWPIIDLETKPRCQSSRHAFVPIMTGCNNFCSYCVVPYTRGRESSRPAQEITEEVIDLVKKGYKEIMLLGQNVNSYQGEGQSLRDSPLTKNCPLPLNFPKLLKILNNLPGNFEIKFLTSHPKDMSDELIEVIAQGEKISKEIHLPVQSADDEILKKMNRQYTVKDYKNLVKKIRQKIPQARISTDIIVGFPGETKKQFQKTVKLIEEMKFSQAYVAAYSPRAGTTAAKLKDDVPSLEKKRRKKVLLEMFTP